MQANPNKVALLIAIVGFLSTLFLPIVAMAPNRIMPGVGIYLKDYLPIYGYIFYLFIWISIFILALVGAKKPWTYLLPSAIGLWLLCYFSGYYAHGTITPGNPYARVSFSAGFWVAAILWLLLIFDHIQNIQQNYFVRFIWMSIIFGGIGLFIVMGIWDKMSLMVEYASEKSIFWVEALRHVQLVLGATILALFIALPLAIYAAKSRLAENIIFGFLNITQTIPSMALFGLLIAPFAALVVLFPYLSQFGIGGIGWAPALVTLTLYALLPIARNILVAITEIPPQITEAATAMGMTKRQIFVKVTLPLSLPLILTGIRSTIILLIGLTAVAGLIGAGGFGRFIFQGLGEQAIDKIMLGAIPIIIMALVVDLFFEASIYWLKREG